ncbi:MAG: exodeoxyribonuclease VII large subunit [Emcibacter sp.]|nr:exodeoxyribonuclease VII large subunit [Emcibacter sp.]
MPKQNKDYSNNSPEYSVTELSMALKRTVEDNFGYVRLRGEISGLKRAASGHVYLALKDEKAVLDGIMWKGVAGRLTFRPEDGLEVICTGKLTTYPGRSKYQIVIERMEPAGAGALMALLEERKKKLAAEGLFEASRKKAIPYLPKVIGIVTSPTGAVIRDILHRLSDRFPRHVLVWPVLVQGDGAAEQIAEAIRGFNQLDEAGPIPRPDLLIVARGGGSLEDLWCFNEEVVIRAVADSDIPLISAVGHETDTTLIDYASDVRAPTPTAAAEYAVPVRDDLIYTLRDFDSRLHRSLRRSLQDKAQKLEGLSRGLPKPSEMLALGQQRFDDLSGRLPRALKLLAERRQITLDGVGRLLRPDLLRRDIERGQEKTQQLTKGMDRAATQNIQKMADKFAATCRLFDSLNYKRVLDRDMEKIHDLSARMDRAEAQNIQRMSHKFEATYRLFDSLNYKRVLDRGFAVIRDDQGRAVTQAAALASGDGLDMEFSDGHVAATVTGASKPNMDPQNNMQKKKIAVKKKPKAGAQKNTQKNNRKDDERQGTLL